MRPSLSVTKVATVKVAKFLSWSTKAKSRLQSEHRRTQVFTMEGVHVMGVRPEGLGDRSPPVGSRGKAPVESPDHANPESRAVRRRTGSRRRRWYVFLWPAAAARRAFFIGGGGRRIDFMVSGGGGVRPDQRALKKCTRCTGVFSGLQGHPLHLWSPLGRRRRSKS